MYIQCTWTGLQINISSKHMELTPAIEEYATKKLEKLPRFFDRIQSVDMVIDKTKNGYVTGQAGWFSCRSACYLAAGRPVIVQETGFSNVLPVGEGVLAFTDLEEASERIREVERDYERHASAARALAREFFDSGSVLNDLIERAMAPPLTIPRNGA